jgi:hypothetical protein
MFSSDVNREVLKLRCPVIRHLKREGCKVKQNYFKF